MRAPDPIPACPDFLEDFSAYVDGLLAPARRSEIQAHLDCCESCLRHLSAYRRGIEAYRAATAEVEHEEFWVELERRMWTEGQLAGATPRRRARRWTRTPAFAVAASAAFALLVFGAGSWSERLWPGQSPAEARGDREVVAVGPAADAALAPVAARPEAPVGRPAAAPAEREDEPRVVLASVLPTGGGRAATRAPARAVTPASEPADTGWEPAIERVGERIRDAAWAAPEGGWAEPIDLRGATGGTTVGPTSVRSSWAGGAAPIRAIDLRATFPADQPAGGAVPVDAWPVEAILTIP